VDRDLPDYVAAYLLERAIAQVPEEVLEVLATLSPEQIEGLRRSAGPSTRRARSATS
jgi:hypothetical protein